MAKSSIIERYFGHQDVNNLLVEDFSRHAEYLTARAIKATATIMLILTALFWPTDWIIFKNKPEYFDAFQYWRITLIAVSGFLYLYLTKTPLRIGKPSTVSAIGICIIVGISGWLMGKIGGIDSPFFYGIYTAPLVTVLLVIEIKARTFWNIALVSVFLASFFFADSRHLNNSLIGAPVVWLSAMTVTYIFTGHVAYAIIKINYLQGRLLDQKNSQLEKLTNALENKVDHQTDEINQLANNLVSIQEQERLRIAMELHDSLGQLLTGLNIELHKIHLQLESSDLNGINDSTGKMTSILTTINNEIDQAITSLAPQKNIGAGLHHSIDKMVRQFSQETGINITFVDENTESLVSESTLTAIFRIIQESLTNIARHSGAENGTVRLSIDKNKLHLLIHDDGQGFNFNQVKKGLGIFSIRERTRQIGGRVRFDSAEGQGVRIEVELPI